MSTQYTPGPWTAQHHDGPISIVSLESEPQQVIAQMIVRGSPTIRRTAKANARLIAAAPDLLAALKLAFEHMYACGGECDGSLETCPQHKVEAAIAKAELPA